MPTNELILHVDMTPDAGLPLRVLRAYRANCDIRILGDASLEGSKRGEVALQKQLQRAALFDKAITTLERAAKFRQAAIKSGKALGRPAPMARLLPKVKQLLRAGHTGSEIYDRLSKCKPSPSLAWVYQQIGKLKK